jgi:hypothetical protein
MYSTTAPIGRQGGHLLASGTWSDLPGTGSFGNVSFYVDDMLPSLPRSLNIQYCLSTNL